MKRKALAVAVGALFIAPAAQAQIVFGNETLGTLQFYGKLYPQFGYGKSKGATQPGESVSTLASTTGVLTGAPVGDPGPRNAIDVQNSYIGLRGERVLGGTGLKAIWQIETAVNFDNPDAANTSGINAGGGTNAFWSTRNSFAGLRGGFGTVKLGNMDTIYKEYGDTFSMFGISSGNFVSASNVLSHIGVNNNRLARFHERRPNSIQYETPQFAGLTAGLQYSPDETKADVGNNFDGSLYSAGVKWDSGPFYASLHHERHNDFFGGSANAASSLSNIGTAGAHSRDKATRASGEWRFGGHRLVVDVARMEWKERGQAAGTKFASYKHTNWGLGWDARWGGPWRTAIQYLRGSEGKCTLTVGDCSTTGLKGQQVSLGVAYTLDRQTFLYAIAAHLRNDKSARYDNWAASSPARGGDVSQAAVGLSYTF
jgi:predicted porin